MLWTGIDTGYHPARDGQSRLRQTRVRPSDPLCALLALPSAPPQPLTYTPSFAGSESLAPSAIAILCVVWTTSGAP